MGTLTVVAGFSLRQLKLAATRLQCNLFNALINKQAPGQLYRKQKPQTGPSLDGLLDPGAAQDPVVFIEDYGLAGGHG